MYPTCPHFRFVVRGRLCENTFARREIQICRRMPSRYDRVPDRMEDDGPDDVYSVMLVLRQICCFGDRALFACLPQTTMDCVALWI